MFDTSNKDIKKLMLDKMLEKISGGRLIGL